MRMTTILGGVASSAVIVAMAVVYMTAERATAAVDPAIYIAAVEPEYQNVTVFEAKEDTPRPKRRPENSALPFHAQTNDELYCLAQNIYFEARGESLAGQEAVAWVTLNRLMDSEHPSSICKVVWEDSQFSWTHDGKSDKPKNNNSWLMAQIIAYNVIESYGVKLDPTKGATYFHADYVKPSWAKSFDRVVRIDNHIFYADNG